MLFTHRGGASSDGAARRRAGESAVAIGAIGTNEWMNGDQGRRAEQSWLFPNELPLETWQ